MALKTVISDQAKNLRNTSCNLSDRDCHGGQLDHSSYLPNSGRLASGFCTRKAAFDRDLRTVLPKKTVLVVDDLRRLNESNKGWTKPLRGMLARPPLVTN